MLLNAIKDYFKAKLENKKTGAAPEGICPNCWGKQEWDGKFYEKIKANNITPEMNTYTSFIHEVVEKLDKITLKEDTYECTSCKTKFAK